MSRQLRTSTALTVGCLAWATACGGAPAREEPAPRPASSVETEGSEAPAVDDGPVLAIGSEIRIGDFAVLADGTVQSEFVFGRVAADGTLYRPNGAVAARIARDGTITLERPERADPEFESLRVEGDALIMTASGREITSGRIENGEWVTSAGRQPIEGLTAESHRTVLAAQALFMLIVVIEIHPQPR